MRYASIKDSVILQRSALGPAAIAARANASRLRNLGLRQVPFRNAATLMTTGGSYGRQLLTPPEPMLKGLGAHHRGALSCLCGPGDPKFGALAMPAVVKMGPIPVRMIQLRKSGVPDRVALLDALAVLDRGGMKVLTPEMHLQLAAGLQPLQNALAGFLGSLGLAPVVGAGITGGSVAASGVGTAAATAAGIGGGMMLGQTAIPIPVVGAVVGAVIFEAIHLMQRHVGTAEASWTNKSFLNSLNTVPGRNYTDSSFSEAFKGMMDTNGAVFPGCGPDRHKNPDCILGPLANAIAQGYLNQTVPLSATTAQVFNSVVVPWISSGAGGLIANQTWLLTNPSALPGRLMFQAATDKYLAGQAMTRGDMPAYQNTGAHTLPLVQALQPILQQPTTTTPMVPGAQPAVPPTSLPPATPYTPPPPNVDPLYNPAGGGGVAVLPAIPTGMPPQINYNPPPYPPSSGGVAVGYALPVSPAVLPAATQAGFGAGLPSWAIIGIAMVGLGFLFFKQGPVTSPPKV